MLWAKDASAIGNRAEIISVLRHAAGWTEKIYKVAGDDSRENMDANAQAAICLASSDVSGRDRL